MQCSLHLEKDSGIKDPPFSSPRLERSYQKFAVELIRRNYHCELIQELTFETLVHYGGWIHLSNTF